MPNPNHDPHTGEFSEGSGSGTPASGGQKFASKAELARASYRPPAEHVQQIAEAVEQDLSKWLSAQRTGDNRPFDLVKGKNAIEVKTLVNTKNDKITMNRAALDRKAAFAKENKVTVHTVVVDKRGPKSHYYYAAAVGSFRIGSMKSVSMVQLRAKFT